MVARMVAFVVTRSECAYYSAGKPLYSQWKADGGVVELDLLVQSVGELSEVGNGVERTPRPWRSSACW